MVSINDGKVRHDWTRMSADHVVHRENKRHSVRWRECDDDSQPEEPD